MKKWTLIFCLSTAIILPKTDEDIERIKEGNFALLPSQQPGPLFGFGQNIIQKDALQLFTVASSFQGFNLHFTSVIPALLYGITDNFSLFINIPIVAKFQLNNQHSQGIGDILAQTEYAIFNNDSSTAADQITIVANVTMPTGSATKTPPTGFGAPSIFLGFTASHLALDWYYFISSGAIITTSRRDTTFSNQVLYQCGLGKNIKGIEDTYIATWLIEMNGTWAARSPIHGITNQDSGSNIIFVGPSLFISTPHLLMQGGISFPVLQQLRGQSHRNRFFAEIQAAWTF